jgi:octaprenyl-diphosphate synthase
LDLVKNDLERVEREISLESVAERRGGNCTIGRYLQSGGGKRCAHPGSAGLARLVGAVTDGAIRMAAVVEMIHTATLVHDDVIDIAKTRRGRPSPTPSGAITPACWPATGCTCRPSRWPCANAISACSIC